jgi:hypothetical protein
MVFYPLFKNRQLCRRMPVDRRYENAVMREQKVEPASIYYRPSAKRPIAFDIGFPALFDTLPRKLIVCALPENKLNIIKKIAICWYTTSPFEKCTSAIRF